MISFIKKLFGIGSKDVVTHTNAPYKIEPAQTTIYIEPAKPVIKTEVATVAPAATAPAKKNRRPRNRNKAKSSTAGGTVAKVGQPKPAITEGKTKGGNGAVKQQSNAPAKVAKVKSTKPVPQQANRSK